MTDGVTLAGALSGAQRILAAAGVPNPQLEARLLASHALGITSEMVLGYPERRVDLGRKAKFDAAVNRRAQREPLAHILGRREFWSLSFHVGHHTLVPRPDTETLVEAVLNWLGGHNGDLRILDLGTGSGCILLALLAELPRAWGVGVDLSMHALEIARQNAAALGLADRADFVRGDWANGLHGRFDVVISNPPYIADRDIIGLEPEVSQFEPRLALSGGPDGLTAYRAIVPHLGRLLARNGSAFLEIGAGGAADVTKLVREQGFEHIEIKDDFASIPRCVRIANTI